MKKLLLLPLLFLSIVSCDFMLKERDDSEAEVNTEEKIVLGTDKDEKGCVTSAGYKWSQLRNECIRVFEEGYRLNTVDSLKTEDIASSAFVVFDKEATQAELYLPNTEKSVLMKKEGSGIYKNSGWSLHTNKNYQLRNKGVVLYAAAVVHEAKIIGDDWKGGTIGNPEPAAKDTVTQ